MHRPAEITFYDELGVAPNATHEEIRDSFRALVRIVHPDHQTDEQLKEIAERQMRKLNRIYSVLSDPEKRRRYDEALEKKDFGPTIILSPDTSVNLSRLAGRLAWAGALVFTLVALMWLSSESPAAHPAQNPERSAPPAPAVVKASGEDPSDEVARLRTDLRSMKLERDLAVRELLRLRGASAHAANTPMPEPMPVNPPPIPATMTELPGAALTLPDAPSAVSARAQPQKTLNSGRPFAGFWFYSKAEQQRGKSSGLYPPEFIEATITEQNGLIRGRYRSRYKIVDRAISPDVSFEFTGAAHGTSMVAPWSGPGGSKGEITLKMTGENALKIDWTTTELGSSQGLVTGTATLTRRLD